MQYEELIYEKEGSIAKITLNRPDKLNAWTFDGPMTRSFYLALDEAENDDEIKVVIVKGAGRAFSAGHDLNDPAVLENWAGKPGQRRPSQRARLKLERLGYHRFQRLFLYPKVTIAQVHGHAIGEGLENACFCDMMIVASNAQIGHSDQRLGHSGTAPNMGILIMKVGLTRARDLLLTGRLMSGEEAAEIGLATKAVPAEQLEEETMRVARAIALLPADGIAIGKTMALQVYHSLGLVSTFASFQLAHCIYTNIRFEPNDYNFFRENKYRKTGETLHARDARYKGLI